MTAFEYPQFTIQRKDSYRKKDKTQGKKKILKNSGFSQLRR